MRLFSADETRAALPMPALVDAIARLLAEEVVVPPRQVLQVGDGLTTLLMPAWLEGRRFGLKTVHVAPGNAARGLPAVAATYQLFDAETGAPLASLDGAVLTARRTAAVAALAARHVARPDAARLLVVGGGAVARELPEAFGAARPLTEVAVWTRRPEAARALAQAWRVQGIAARAVEDLDRATADADIVATATLAESPLVQGASLRDDAHLSLIGGYTPAMREADDACLVGAQVWVDTELAIAGSGDLATPLASGALRPDAFRGTLAELCAGAAPPRAPVGRTVFKTVGTALADLAAALLAVDGPPPSGGDATAARAS